MKLILALCVFSAGTLHAADDWRVVLKNIERTVAEAVNRSDNYICTQDLSRVYYATLKADIICQQPPVIPSILPLLEDRLKLDVAVSEGAEIYSWHGEHKFSSTNVTQVVREGPISSGGFNGYLRNIFGERDVNFTFRGRSVMNDLDLYHFDFDVPLAASHYDMQAGKGLVKAPFHGSFSAITGNYELYSLTVTATGDQIPKKSDICAAQTRLTYQMVQMANHQSLLPASFDLLIGNRDGIFTDSKGRFSGCREYTGESTVHFDVDGTAKVDPVLDEVQSEPLKPGIYLPIALRSEIDEDSAYAGLPVETVLLRKVKVKKNVVLSRGAALRGTVTRFQIFHQPDHMVAMRIEFNSIADGRRLFLCNASHEVTQTSPLSYGVSRRRATPPPTSTQSEKEEDADGAMLFRTPHMHLDKSFTGVFVTVGQSQSESQ